MTMLIINLTGILITWAAWLWLINHSYTPQVTAGIAVGGVLATIPIIYLGRRMLDKQPDIPRAVVVTSILHYVIAILVGGALIEAVFMVQNLQVLAIQVPVWVGIVLMIVGGLGALLTVFNLALKGLGAPFAIALTRLVTTDWLYAWSRNPMIISVFAFLLGLGLFLNSALFILWLLAILSPAMLVFLKVYEERELEIRFGKKYLEYKAKTPMLFGWF